MKQPEKIYELVEGECADCDLRDRGAGCSKDHEECLAELGKCWKEKTNEADL